MSLDGVARIAAERRRQVEVEGYTADHDREHGGPGREGVLARAAAAYAMASYGGVYGYDFWPFPDDWKKPATNAALNTADRIRDLTRAGALIAAEIDRLQADGSGP